MVDHNLNGFRAFMFWAAATVTFTVILVSDYFNLADPAILSYMATTLVAVVCGFMFADWWRVKGSASSIYKWLTLLLFALAFNDFMQCVARYAYIFHGKNVYEQVIDSTWWQYRSSLKLLALLYLLSFAMWQRFGRSSTYSNGIKQDMANGFNVVEARILSGEIRFAGHSHEGLVLDAKLIIKPEGTDENTRV